jgi:hypothetical protein
VRKNIGNQAEESQEQTNPEFDGTPLMIKYGG